MLGELYGGPKVPKVLFISCENKITYNQNKDVKIQTSCLFFVFKSAKCVFSLRCCSGWSLTGEATVCAVSFQTSLYKEGHGTWPADYLEPAWCTIYGVSSGIIPLPKKPILLETKVLDELLSRQSSLNALRSVCPS